MLKADFPLYAYDQKVGDLVVFAPATAHQVWNPPTLCTKMVWNILHPLSLEVGFQSVQPSFNRLCHPDLARTNLSLACAMMSLVQDGINTMPLPPDLPLLSRLFRQMVHDESIDTLPATAISRVGLPPNVIATCNFCSTAIWNRHVRCTQCADFDLCLLCYVNGRSCEHPQAYAWAEIVPSDQCNQILNRAREILGYQQELHPAADTNKTLGTAVNDLMRAKNSPVTRLCHLCRIDHPEWKGRRCDKCTAFFCYRGLFRHFDMHSGDVLRHNGQWTCPKCQEVCNCRCCHFNTAYVKSEKPASKRRVKAADSRGKNMGFADNVFDQKRGRRESHLSDSTSLPSVPQIAGKKRPLAAVRPATPLRKIELPTPEPDYSSRRFRDSSDLFVEPPYTNGTSSSHPTLLPSVKAIAEGSNFMISPPDDRSTRVSVSPGVQSLASTIQHNTLPPMLTRGPLPSILNTNGHSNAGTHHLAHPSATTSAALALLSQTQSTTSPTSHHFPTFSEEDTKPTLPLLASTTSNTILSDLNTSITHLDSEIRKLRQYEAEFASLGLGESTDVLRRQVEELEERIRGKRREKGRVLCDRLRAEGWGELAGVVGREVGLGLEVRDVG